MDAKKSTIRDVAEYAKVSKSTVSRYLNNENVIDECRDKIKLAIERLNYEPSIIARGFKNKKSYTIGVLVPVFADMFSATIAMAIEKRLEVDGYSMIMCEYQGDNNIIKRKLDFLNSKMADGIMIISPNLDASYFQSVIDRKIPIVTIDNPIQGINADQILLNNEKISHDGVKYLIENGHRRIAIINGSRGGYTAELRRKGYLRALEENNIPAIEDYTFYSSSFSGNYESIIEKLFSLNEKPTALFITNYYLLLGVIMELNKRNIKFPENISILGFDNIKLSQLIKPSLTIISQPMQEMGEMAAEFMMGRIKNKTIGNIVKYFEGELIIGQSVKKLN